MDETEQISETLHMIHGNSNTLNEIIFHAVYIPEENLNFSMENNIKGKYIKINNFFSSLTF